MGKFSDLTTTTTPAPHGRFFLSVDTMFERLIDLFVDFLSLFKFLVVINEFERGIVLTLGRPRERRLGFKSKYLLDPGVHFVWPFAIEHVFVANVVPATARLDVQSLTTSDGHSIVIAVVLTWRVTSIEKMTLKVEDYKTALQDVCCGVIGTSVERSTWAEIHTVEWNDVVGKEIRRRAMRWGMGVDDVMFVDKTRSLSFRIMGINPQPPQQEWPSE